jgi:hypothetical protein
LPPITLTILDGYSSVQSTIGWAEDLISDQVIRPFAWIHTDHGITLHRSFTRDGYSNGVVCRTSMYDLDHPCAFEYAGARGSIRACERAVKSPYEPCSQLPSSPISSQFISARVPLLPYPYPSLVTLPMQSRSRSRFQSRRKREASLLESLIAHWAFFPFSSLTVYGS